MWSAAQKESEIKHNMLAAPLLNLTKTYKTKYGLLHKTSLMLTAPLMSQKLHKPKMWPAA